jgi:peptidylprolyl isomerase
MKKILTSSLLAASTLVLAGCEKSENKMDTNKHVEQTEDARMTRQKIDSGLEYEVLQEGTGKSPQKGDRISVHYTGWLDENGEKGKKFDSSVDRGQPFVFTVGVGQVIRGWDEGLLLMKEGEKRRLIIPADLAYGSRSVGAIIPANATLIFDVELIEVL